MHPFGVFVNQCLNNFISYDKNRFRLIHSTRGRSRVHTGPECNHPCACRAPGQRNLEVNISNSSVLNEELDTLIARFMGPTWAHLGPTGPRWAPCWPHELCYLGRLTSVFQLLLFFWFISGLQWFSIASIGRMTLFWMDVTAFNPCKKNRELLALTVSKFCHANDLICIQA